MVRSRRARIAAAALLAGVVLAHCIWLLAVGLHIARRLLDSPPVGARFWLALAGAAAVGAVVWLGVAIAGVGVLALWLRVQRVRP